MSKMCQNCNAVLDDTANFCEACGAPQNQYFSTPTVNAVPFPAEALTEKQFYDRYASKKTKSLTTAIAVIAFITAGASVIMLLLGNILSLIDIAFYVPMGILALTTKKWGFPLAITIYSGIFSVISMLSSGLPSGFVSIVIGILATISLRKVSKAYQYYKSTGQLPQDVIQ